MAEQRIGIGCELSGHELDAEIRRVVPDLRSATGPVECDPALVLLLIERFDISLSPPGSPVHRNGGNRPGWGESGMWGATSWRTRRADRSRAISYSLSSPGEAVCRFVVDVHTPKDTPA